VSFAHSVSFSAAHSSIVGHGGKTAKEIAAGKAEKEVAAVLLHDAIPLSLFFYSIMR
jgi:hypothetical protein